MNYLAICQAVRRECTESGTGPSAVTGQSGILARIVSWVSDGYTDIQTDCDDWLWLRSRFTVNTVAGTASYAYGSCTDVGASALITRFARWLIDRDKNGFPQFSAYLASTGVGGEFSLVPMLWERFERVYQFGSQTNGQPRHVAVDPATQKFVLGPTPDAVYTVRGPYQKSPQVLAADADIPEMPAQYHMLIAYEAMLRYGGNRIAVEAIARAKREGGTLRNALERNQRPRLTFSAPLA